MKNIVLEELNRVKLLMSYNSKNTLSENIEIINLVESKKIISEQTGKAFLKAIFGTQDDIARAIKNGVADSKYALGVKLFDDIAVTGFRTSDDLMQALLKGTLSKAQLGELAKGLMKTGKATGNLRTTLTNKAADLAVKDARYANMTQKEVKNALTKKGYDPSVADEIASKFVNKKGLPVTGGKGKTTTTTPINPGISIPSWIKVPDWWKYGWTTTKKWFKRALWIAGVGAGLTAIYLAWKTFFGDDDDLPPCAKLLVTNEVEFEKYLENGYITMGKYTIYQDKKVKMTLSTGEELKGKWSYNTETETIVADFNGRIVNVPCAPGTENPEPEPEKNPVSQKSRYVVCPNFPLTKGCKGEKVEKAQECLGGLVVDGKFGKNTQDALVDKGYGTVLTQEVYDKIISNCGGTTTTTTIWEPTRTGADSDEYEK